MTDKCTHNHFAKFGHLPIDPRGANNAVKGFLLLGLPPGKR